MNLIQIVATCWGVCLIAMLGLLINAINEAPVQTLEDQRLAPKMAEVERDYREMFEGNLWRQC